MHPGPRGRFRPRPIGAGFVVKQGGVTLLSGAVALGMGDNNVGETAALGELAYAIKDGILEGKLTGDRALLFSDSAGVMGFLCRGWRPPTAVALSREARRSVAELRKIIKVDMFQDILKAPKSVFTKYN